MDSWIFFPLRFNTRTRIKSYTCSLAENLKGIFFFFESGTIKHIHFNRYEGYLGTGMCFVALQNKAKYINAIEQLFSLLLQGFTQGDPAQHEHKSASDAAYHLVVLVLHIVDAELDEAVLVDGPIGRQTHTSQEQRISCSLTGKKRQHGVCEKGSWKPKAGEVS